MNSFVIFEISCLKSNSERAKFFLTEIAGGTSAMNMANLHEYFTTYHRPVWAEIDLDGIEHNLREFRRILPAQTQIMAVVKADAYGHGAYQVAQTALQSGASWLAVALVEEGICLRRKGITAPLLLLGISAPGTEHAVLEHDLRPMVCTVESARRFSECGQAMQKTVQFHLKLDTGMGRVGVRPDNLPTLLDTISDLPNLEMEGVFTHFAKADETDKTYSHLQIRRFQECLHRIRQGGFAPRFCYLANSAGTMELPDAHADMARIGISLYGMYPSAEVDPAIVHLKPVLCWKTRVVHLKTLPPGEAVSYGGLFVTQRPTVVATLPVGYADGFRRRLWKQHWHVLIRGQRAPIIGRICMDMCMIDATDIPGVMVGDEVVLIGSQGAETILADDMATALDTINYEITCLVGKRVPRIYRRQGEIIGIESLLGEHAA
ncbi:alanine racemase [Candidatus Moduliflexus flocculans]|uniref:Alanine racemase n=1 Tax=Candidatus Moduliflexus flocculans TaxID=1499966 RepID=A0A0S6VUW3_9BACT|nr:alanine racemase [Candidatus Moduliflexus flocculans]